MTKVSFFTLGCRVNQAETSVLEEVFRRKGFLVTEAGSESDILIVNTCTVTGQADLDASRVLKRVSRSNPFVRIALIGCQAQVQREKLFDQGNVHWVVGAARKMDIADIILSDLQAERKILVGAVSRKPFTMPVVNTVGRRMRANLKIQDGCDNFCAYCEIPFARGRARSRKFEDVMAAAKALADAGHKEIVLTGINVGVYAHEGKCLVDVIKGVGKISAVQRVRLSSIEYAPWIEKLTGLMTPSHKLCRFLHIPLQSGCDRILLRMGRRYRTRDIAEALSRMHKKIKGLMVGADVIVGFPGETDEDFEETFSFLRRVPVNYLHVFSYSHRHRARSRCFKGEVPADVIRERSRRLRALGIEKRLDFLKDCVGGVFDVLFEQKKDGHWIGHTDNYVTIKVSSGKDLRNQLLPVRALRIEGDRLAGAVVFDDRNG